MLKIQCIKQYFITAPYPNPPLAISLPAGVKDGKRDEWVGRRPVPWDFYILAEDSRAVASSRKTEGKKISGNNL